MDEGYAMFVLTIITPAKPLSVAANAVTIIAIERFDRG